MKRIPDIPPVIPELTNLEKVNQPIWSIMIPVYNCSNYLRETLCSVLQQAADPEVMQIEVVDDYSTDADVEQLVKDIGKGRISYFRQSENVGSLRNFERCILRAKGKLIHLLHGDDLVLPGFYKSMQSLFESFPEVGAAFCRHQYINEEGELVVFSECEMDDAGVLDNWLVRLFKRQRIQTPSIVVKREVYEALGSFYAVHYGEDWEMWLRIAAYYSFAYTPEILAAYRQHPVSISGRYFLDGQNIRDLKKVMALTEKYIPTSERAKLRREARQFYGRYAVNTARRLWSTLHNKKGARAQMREGLKIYKDLWMIKECIKLNIKMTLNIS